MGFSGDRLECSDEIDLRNEDASIFINMVEDIIRQRKLFFFCVVLTACVVFLYSFSIEKKYGSESKLISNQSVGNGLSSSLSGTLGSLSSLAGIDLSSTHATSPTDKAMAVMVSRNFLFEFIEKNNLKPMLFPDSWDQDKNKWKKPGFFYSGLSLIGLKKKKDSLEPSDEEAYLEFVDNNIIVSQSPKDNLVSLKIYAPEASLAQQLNQDIIRLINQAMQIRDASKARERIEYLQRKIETERSVEIQKVLFELIETESKRLMLSEVGVDYVFSVIDDPSLPDEPAGPGKSMYGILGLFLGIILGLAVIVMRRFARIFL